MRDFFFSAWENLVYILLGILALNVIFLDVYTFASKPKPIIQNINLGNNTSQSASPSSVSGSTASQNVQIQSAPSAQDYCPNTCLTAIKTATASLKLTQQVVNTNTTTQQVSSGANEYFVPFGSASFASTVGYTTVPGLQATIDMSQYTNIQSVVFEISVGGNGIIEAQLFDSTDNTVVQGSQVSMQGGNAQLLISPPLSLPSSKKVYQVQIQTQLNYPATINQARLHITLK